MISNNKPIFALTLLIVLVNLIAFSRCSVEECYTCYYIEADNITASDLPSSALQGDFKPDKSCRSSKKPDKDLISQCSHHIIDGMRFTCTKVFYHGEVVGGHVLKATARACMPWPENSEPKNSCSAKTLGEVINSTLSSEVRQALGLLTNYVDESSSGLFCSCNSDSCNSATKSRSYNSNFAQYILWFFIYLFYCTIFNKRLLLTK
ncbi:unnamed protein product [Orchesella dallaii]|uniref:Protein quiver n=1 Tax=Orchesella dallaii TaxID=48710 RepID=A0ABP1RW99_9HEXA